ncbi:MAG TPA: sigma-70 family RNA polymerase sigma factor [Pyrinomonadaceae bacterium]
MNTGEDELIRRAQGGDSDAFCQIARTHQRRIYALALHYCRSPEDAEDLSQEVWLKAYRSVRSFRGQSSFYTWLRQITVNTFLNHQRAMTYTLDSEKTTVKMEELGEADGANGAGVHHGADAEADFHQRLLVGRVMRALGELTPQQRLAFLLKHREGMTYQEIAEAFGCSAGAVKKSLFRAVSKLRESLGVGEAAAGADCVALGAGGLACPDEEATCTTA